VTYADIGMMFSELSPDRYQTLSGSTMDNLLVFLEDVMETDGNAENGWEVEYDVCIASHIPSLPTVIFT
jgi:hypothetical protein